MSQTARLLLAVESATPTLSVALMRGAEILAERTARPGAHHAETLLPLIEEVLGAADTRENEIEGFGVSIGPGSFTSLRVGLATVKGLAFATSRQAVAVSTLAALACGLARDEAAREPEEAIVSLLDARRGEVYAGVFEAETGAEIEGAARSDRSPLREVGTTGLFSPAELCARLPARCVLIGDGAACVEASGVPLPRGARFEPSGSREPTASAVGMLAGIALGRGEGVDPADLVPRYVRRAEAEVTRTAQRVES